MEERVSSAAEITIEEKTPPAAPVSDRVAEPPVTIIERQPGWRLVNLRELWRYRELLFFLVWRDVKVRYKQTVLGVAWSVLQPLATMFVFTLFIGQLPNAYTAAVPYQLFVFAGLLPWTFFANAIGSAGGSVVGSQNLVTKVYFPRLIIPMGAVGANLVDFLVAFAMLLVMMVYYHNDVALTPALLLVPLIFLFLVIAALGVGTLLAALTVAYRDFRYVVPFMIQFWMFATPTIYLQVEAVVGPRGRTLLPLNPAYGLISNFRQAMLGGDLDWYALGVSAAVSVFMLLVGCFYFRRVERSFADII